MGQLAAAVAPPIDPALDRPLDATGNATAANADDLLAALAGEQIDRLLAESEAGPPAVAVVPPPVVVTPPAPSPAADVVSAADLDAVLAVAAAEPSPALPPTPPVPQRTGLPLLLKPLAWANAPVAACPDRVREVVGKIAIVTFINAVGVLAYTFAFHRPH